MKILVVTTAHRPDDDRIYYKEILSLLEKYPEVHVVAPVDKGEAFHLAAGVVLHALPRKRGLTGRLLTIFWAAVKTIRLQPDICHFHDLEFVFLAPFLRLFCRAKLIYDVHEVYPESLLISPRIPAWLRPVSARIVDFVEKGCARFCAHIVTADEPNTASFARIRVPATTVFNYPRLSLFQVPAERVNELRNSYPGRRILIYQGTMARNRGLFHMLDGIHLLKEAVPEVLLLLVGLKEGELRTEVQERIRRDQLNNHVVIIPWVPHADVPAYIALAEIGLAPLQPNPKFDKNIPLKIFEYMACGVPVLAANLPAIAPFIADSGAGMLYNSTDAQSFACEAQRMLRDSAHSEAMGRAGRDAVERWWNWEEMETRLIQIYSGLESRSHADVLVGQVRKQEDAL